MSVLRRPRAPRNPQVRRLLIRVHWHACENFGDALTPYLVEKITGRQVIFAEANSSPAPIMVTGSILGCNIKQGIVWGTGCAFEYDLDPKHFTKPSNSLRIFATRGALSKKLVEESGHTPSMFGDPGLLISRFYKPKIDKKYDVGIICSWVDFEEVYDRYKNDPKILVINSMGNVERIIDMMLSCNTIISSTLHGLAAAISYGVPCALVRFSDRMIGDGFKFRDFLTCTTSEYSPIDLQGKTLTVKELMNLTFVHELSINLEALFNSCPFRFR